MREMRQALYHLRAHRRNPLHGGEERRPPGEIRPAKSPDGLLRACEKRPVPFSKLEQIVNEAESFVIDSAERERKTSEIGELIMNRLKAHRQSRLCALCLGLSRLQRRAGIQGGIEAPVEPRTRRQSGGRDRIRAAAQTAATPTVSTHPRSHQPDHSKSEELRMPKQHTITLIPGDGIGPEVTNAAVRILEAPQRPPVQVSSGRALLAGAEAFEKYHGVHSQRAVPIDRAQPRRAEGPGHHADRRRLRQHQRHAAQAVRALRQLPPHPQSARHADPLSRTSI